MYCVFIEGEDLFNLHISRVLSSCTICLFVCLFLKGCFFLFCCCFFHFFFIIIFANEISLNNKTNNDCISPENLILNGIVLNTIVLQFTSGKFTFTTKKRRMNQRLFTFFIILFCTFIQCNRKL